MVHIFPVVVINLAKRTDRFESVKNEMKKQQISWYRFDAYPAAHEGWRGCRASQIESVSHGVATSRGYFMICEDDIQWVMPWKDVKIVFEQTVKHYDPDIFMIYKTPVDLISTDVPNVSKVVTALGGACYIVKKEYGLKLINHWKHHPDQPIDMSWQSLQRKHRWYAITDIAVIQKPGFSDIENRMVDYTYLQTPDDDNKTASETKKK